MEGFPGWLFLGIFAAYGLALIALLPALAAVVCLLARRTERSRTLFATTLLVEAVLGSAFCFLAISQVAHADADPHPVGASVGLALTGVNLLLAGVGQYVAARRGSRPWPPALALGAGVVPVVLLWHSLEYPPAVAALGLPLAVACLLVGVLRARTRGAKGGGGRVSLAVGS